ncbi:MAG: Hpt domain-containing protein [Deltaproteobacteria bacterium]|nr:Hpt domain-containing protein [Deltaproteobacteria bacterium]
MHHDQEELALLDYAGLFERTGEDEEMALEVLDDLKGTAPEELEQLRAAFEAKDATAARRTAHRLKGAFLAVGANRAAAAARDVEELANDDLDAARGKTERLVQLWTDTLVVVDEIVRRGGVPT